MHPRIKMFHCLLLINTSHSYVSKEAAHWASPCTDSAPTSAMFTRQGCKISFTSNPKQRHTGKADSVSQVERRRFQKGWKHQSSTSISMFYGCRAEINNRGEIHVHPSISLKLKESHSKLLNAFDTVWNGDIETPCAWSSVATGTFFST